MRNLSEPLNVLHSQKDRHIQSTVSSQCASFNLSLFRSLHLFLFCLKKKLAVFRFSYDIRSLKTSSSWRRRGVSVREVGHWAPLCPPRELRRSHFNPLQTPPCCSSPPCLNTNIRGQVWALSTSDQTRAAAGYARLRTVGLIGLEAPRWAKGHLQSVWLAKGCYSTDWCTVLKRITLVVKNASK